MGVLLGRTPCEPEEVLRILARLRRQWQGSSYDLLRRNCAHFCVELVRRLRVGGVPQWVNKLAGVGENMVQWLSAAAGQVSANTEERLVRWLGVDAPAACRDEAADLPHADGCMSLEAEEAYWESTRAHVRDCAKRATKARRGKPAESKWASLSGVVKRR